MSILNVQSWAGGRRGETAAGEGVPRGKGGGLRVERGGRGDGGGSKIIGCKDTYTVFVT